MHTINPQHLVYDGSNVFIKDDCGFCYRVLFPQKYDMKDYQNETLGNKYRRVTNENEISCIDDIIGAK